MNVLSLVAYNRPELLKIYLDQLLKDSKELSSYLVHIFLDYGYDPLNLKVVKWFHQQHPYVKITCRTPEEKRLSPLAGFYNILKSYQEAGSETDDFIVVGEDDIIPASDYLRFNRECYKRFLSKYDKLFCVCHKRRQETEVQGDPEVLIGDYQLTSPSCISKKVIQTYIVPLLSEGLWSNPIEFYRRAFPTSRIPPNEHIHQDGFLERIAEKASMFSLKPDQARTCHIGVGGQHSGQGKKIEGTFDERVARYYYLIAHKDELLEYASQHKEDITTISLDFPCQNEYILDLDRTKAKASSWWYDKDNNFRKYICS